MICAKANCVMHAIHRAIKLTFFPMSTVDNMHCKSDETNDDFPFLPFNKHLAYCNSQSVVNVEHAILSVIVSK